MKVVDMDQNMQESAKKVKTTYHLNIHKIIILYSQYWKHLRTTEKKDSSQVKSKMTSTKSMVNLKFKM